MQITSHCSVGNTINPPYKHWLPERVLGHPTFMSIAAAAVACLPARSLLQASNTRFHRASILISRSFRAIRMSAEEPLVSSLTTSASEKICSKVTRKCTLGTGDINKKHEPVDIKCLATKDELTHFQSNAEYEDLNMPSSETQEGVSEAGLKQGLVALKDFDSLMKMTVAELRGMMRKLGIPSTGRKHDLILALKDFSTNRSADQVLGIDLPKKEEHDSSDIIIDQIRNKRKKNHAKGLLDSSVKESQFPVQHVEDSGGKLHDIGHGLSRPLKQYSRKKRSVNVIVKSSSPGEIKNITKSTSRKHENLNREEHAIELTDGDGEHNMLLDPPMGKGLARKKRKAAKSIAESKVVDATAATDAELNFNSEQPWTMLVHKKVQLGWAAYNPTTMRPAFLLDDDNVTRLISWNVNGLRALLSHKKDAVEQLAERENFDVLCLQETKLQEKDVERIKQGLLNGYENSFWACSVSKLGYSGTAVISRIKPVSVRFGLGIPDHDGEGRLITLEFNTFYLVAGYVPNSGQKLERLTYRVQQWDPSLSTYIKDLEKQKPVVLTGDLNCAHEEMDIYNPDGNRRSAGFTNEERSSFELNFLNKGLVDSFRRQHPNKVGYSYWGYRQGARAHNKGWRIDYFLVSDSIIDNVYDSYIIPDVNGSDHCPIGLILKL